MTTSKSAPPAGPGFDPDALHKKYLEERDKRLGLRPHGNTQYLNLDGEFADYAADRYVEPGFTRAPLTDEVDVVVLGGGLTGLVTAVRLREAGITDIRIIDRGGDFGGTWYWNRYPGVRCDIESYIYMPLLEEVGYMPTEKYATGAEIFAHCQAIGRHYSLYEKACFQTSVTSVNWNEDLSRWIIQTDRQDALKARFVCFATGLYSKPKLPGIPGIRDYKGHSFHTCRWDYAYTGGDANGNLSGLADKRVAIIGTGATAIQVVPSIAPYVKELIVFARTPSAVDTRNNRPTDSEWVKTLKPGWQKNRIVNFDLIMVGVPQKEDLVNDRWTDVWSKLAVWAKSDSKDIPADDPAALMQLADYKKMEEIRARIDEVVTNRKTAEALKPWYNLFCKRPLYSDDYLQAFNHPNVKLVDTQGRGVTKITESAIEFEEVLYEVDCIIYATGFQVGVPTYEAGSYELIGRNGLRLADKWKKYVRSLHGIYTHGFPNLFVIGNLSQAATTVNFTHIMGDQAIHVADVIKRCFDKQIKICEVKQEAEDSWAKTLSEKAMDRSQFERECTPGYFNKEGDPDAGASLLSQIYGGGPFEYVRICNDWRVSGFESDMELTYD